MSRTTGTFATLAALGSLTTLAVVGIALTCAPVQLPPVNDPGYDPSVLPAPSINRVNPYMARDAGVPDVLAEDDVEWVWRVKCCAYAEGR